MQGFSCRGNGVGNEAQRGRAIFHLPQFVVREARCVGETLIHVPRRHARAVDGEQGVLDAAMHDVAVANFLREVADPIAQERHIVIAQRGHGEVADAARVGVDDFEQGGLAAWLHRAVDVFHQQMPGLGGAVKIQHRHAEDARENFFMRGAAKFVGAEDEFQRRKFYAAPFAPEREPDGVDGICVEKLRLPFGDLGGHARHLGVRQHERDALEVHEQRPPDDALFARHPDGGAGQSVARGRGERGAFVGGKFIQNFSDVSIEPQRALFLFVPPAAREDDGQPFRGGAGGVFQLDELLFQ